MTLTGRAIAPLIALHALPSFAQSESSSAHVFELSNGQVVAAASTDGVAPTETGSRRAKGQREVYFKSCNDAWRAGVAPIHAGSPGYRTELDGDLDGTPANPFGAERLRQRVAAVPGPAGGATMPELRGCLGGSTFSGRGCAVWHAARSRAGVRMATSLFIKHAPLLTRTSSCTRHATMQAETAPYASAISGASSAFMPTTW